MRIAFRIEDCDSPPLTEPVSEAQSNEVYMESDRQLLQSALLDKQSECGSSDLQLQTGKQTLREESGPVREVGHLGGPSKGENRPSGRQTMQERRREIGELEHVNQEVLQSSGEEEAVVASMEEKRGGENRGEVLGRLDELEKLISSTAASVKELQSDMLKMQTAIQTAMQATMQASMQATMQASMQASMLATMQTTMQKELQTIGTSIGNMDSDVKELKEVSLSQGKQMEDIGKKLKKLKSSEESQGQEQRKGNVLAGKHEELVTPGNLTNNVPSPIQSSATGNLKEQGMVLPAVQPGQQVSVDVPAAVPLKLGAYLNSLKGIDSSAMEVLYSDMVCNLEKYLDSRLNAYAREDADRHRSYNVRFTGYWEQAIEERDPYYVVDNFKSWLNTYFSVPVDRIFGVWRTPMQRSRWPRLQDKAIPVYAYGSSQPLKPGYVRPRDLVVKMKSIADAEELLALANNIYQRTKSTVNCSRDEPVHIWGAEFVAKKNLLSGDVGPFQVPTYTLGVLPSFCDLIKA